MGKRATLTNAFTKGVLDPALSERIDLEHYYNGLESGLNIECSPQGGISRRAGTTVAKPGATPTRIRRRLQPVALTSSMVTASNGGTVANLIDQSTTTAFSTSAASGSTFVVAQLDLGAPKAIVFFDVIGFSCASSRFPRAFGVEYFNGSAWVGFGPTPETALKTLTTSARTRRYGEKPGITRTAQTWRIVAYGASGAGAISIKGIRLWQEKRQLSPVRGRSFARSADLVYEHVLTDRNIDVFRDHEYQASIPIDVDAADVAAMERLQELDTALYFHEDIQPREIKRQGANDEWDSQPVTFSNVAALSPGTAFSGDQDEVQDLALPGLLAGDKLVLWLGASVTAPITYAPATFAADVRSALLAIGVQSGLVVTAKSGVDPALRLSFSGTAGARRWPVVRACVLDIDSIVPVTTIVQRGLASSGPIMGDTTGWPRCGVIDNERLLCAGFRGAPLTYGVSRYGSLYDFQETASPLTADLGFFGTLNAGQLETIRQIFSGRHILFFTESSTWFAERRTIDATQPFNVQFAARVPIALGVPIHMIEGSATFVQDGGRILRDMVYSDVELSYTPEALSLLAPHLLTGVVDSGYRQQRSTREGNQLYLVNADGSICFMSILKTQKVIAAAQWQTDGAFRSAFGDISYRMWVIAERATVSGGADLYLEKMDGSHTLDAATVYDNGGAATDLVTGLGHLEAKTVWAWADRDLVGPLVVSGGQVQLPRPVTRAVVGLFPPLRARLPRLREKLQNGYPWRPPARTYELGLSLAGTGQIDVAVNGGPFRPVTLTDDGTRALDIAAEPPRDTTGIAASSPADSLERLVRGLVMIPGSGEFVYGTTAVAKTAAGGAVTSQNVHSDTGDTDFTASLGQARRAMPALANVSLLVSWFGSDLRCASCEIKPKIDQAISAGTWAPYDWSVQGISRSSADRVSLISGRPAYGGTPADRSVVEAIKHMREAGIAVTLSPFLLMDVAAGNSLANPYGGSSQPAYPWRGRITCAPAPGVSGTVDLTSVAASQVAAFVGTATPADFTIAGETVAYSGPAEWSYRRFVLHYAALAKAAGGVDTFVIGSEMRGLTWVRSALGIYPFVTALAALAADVRAILGTGTSITYAADWTELAAHQTGVAGECFFHLDPLWSSPEIDAIGVDGYWPLADWRAGSEHADWTAGWRSVYDRGYLRSNVHGGEGFDWYYASSGDRTAQARTPITDGAYGKPWVWRVKDLRNWWSNRHYDRPDGVESATPTAWLPQSKPIWIMEAGCPALDNGANQPNVFYDPKSSESAVPYFSGGYRDDAMQRAYLEALLSFYTPGQTGFSDANNPISTVTGRRMVETDRIYAYCWDARFYPAFPRFTDVWGDGDLWQYGHWLTGRLQSSIALDPDALPVGLGPELPLRDRLVTGTVRVTNLRGFSRHGTVEISQSIPAPLELRAIRCEVSYG